MAVIDKLTNEVIQMVIEQIKQEERMNELKAYLVEPVTKYIIESILPGFLVIIILLLLILVTCLLVLTQNFLK